MINHLKKISLSLLIFLSFTNLASAETTMSAEGQYIFNSLGFYLGGVLVAFMAAGFCMLESGFCLLYTSPSPRDRQKSRMPSSA